MKTKKTIPLLVLIAITAFSFGQVKSFYDLSAKTIDGNDFKFSSLKGKKVLIVNTASKCGYTPQYEDLEKLYQKYKNAQIGSAEGFEILSVSLDESKEKWMQAINTDGLIWENHVSDLQGWNSIAAKLYKVNSIPATFLIDKKGIIRAMNVRGRELEQKLLPLL